MSLEQTGRGRGGGGTDAPRRIRPGARIQRVTRDGLALVHRGELVYPAPGAEADMEVLEHDLQTTVRYELPVIVEVVESRSEEPLEEGDDDLRRALEARMSGR